MRAGSHMLVGLAAYAVAAPLTPVPVSGTGAAAALGASLLPDLDHPGSFLGRRVLSLGIGLAAIAALAHYGVGVALPRDLLLVLTAFLLGPVGLMALGHRGLTHSLLGVAGAAAGLWALGWLAHPLVLAAAVGYLSHILADWLTQGGVPLLWPKPDRYHAPAAVVTGGLGEAVIVLAVMAGTWWWVQHWGLLTAVLA